MKKKDKGISLSSPHNPADIHSQYLKIIQHVLTHDIFYVLSKEITGISRLEVTRSQDYLQNHRQ
jgi:hypothetical protein